MNRCKNCRKGIDYDLEYCEWHAPIVEKRDVYHEHSNHRDFKFAVDVHYCGQPVDESQEQFSYEQHALLYTDGYVAVTMFECCYAMWSLQSGKLVGGILWQKDEWCLSKDSCDRIVEFSKR